MARILFVSHSAGLFGAEQCLLDVAAAAQQTGNECLVAVPHTGPLCDRLRQADVGTVVTGHRFWVGPPIVHFIDALPRHLKNTAACRRMPRLLDGFRPDCIYSNTLASPFGAMLAERLKAPHVWHAHEFIREGVGLEFDWGVHRSMQYVGNVSETVICNSHAVARMVGEHVAASRVCVVHNGVTDALHLPPHPRMGMIHPDEPVLVLVGTLMPHKGHADAILAVRLLGQRGVRTRLRIIGTSRHPWYRHQLKWLVRRSGLTDQVSIEGFVPQAGEAVLPSADIALVCTRCEAFGLVAAEAMAAGCPVVGTRAGGLPEVVEDGRSGLLYQPGDVGALADQIQRLIDEPGLYASLSANGIERAHTRFSRSRYLSGIEEVIRHAVGNESRPKPE